MEQRTNRRTSLLGGAALALLAAIALAVVVLSGDDGKTNDRSPTRDEKPANGKATLDTLSADEVTFKDFGVQVPSGPAGPRETAAGRAVGFEHSPAGAVLAAINIFARSESGLGPAVFEPTITEQVVGPDKDKLLANAQRGYQERSNQGLGPNGELTAALDEARANRVSLWAYRVDSYDEAAASLNLLLRQIVPGTTAPAYVNFVLTVRWADGDWRLLAPLNGDYSTVARQLSDLPTTYVVLGRD